MEGELACEELKTQCTWREKWGTSRLSPNFPRHLSSWPRKLITVQLNFSWYDARHLWRSQRWKFRGDLRWHSLPYLPSRW